ncbi:MAG: 3-keto-disaccharide hydrolase [Limisphaerales bacterium]
MTIPKFIALAVALFLPPAAWAAGNITLFNGKNLAGWRPPTGVWQVVKAVSLDPADDHNLAAVPGAGVLVNNPKGHTVDLLTTGEFGDVEAHLEFCIPSKSNSGIYFMGRYELQVYDSYGVAKDAYPGIECGGIYPRWTQERNEFEGHSPRVNSSKPPGEWQTFDVIFRAPRFDASGKKTRNACFVKVVHNGQVIHENVEVTGPTRAAVFDDEKPLGPLMLQGDHGPVAYRHLWVKPIHLE